MLASTDCDVGHGVLRGLDQGKVRVNEQLGHPGSRVPPSAALSRSLLQGFREEGSEEVRGQDFRGIVTQIRRLCLYANIGGPDLENII